jgi:hypothetical protein
VYTISEMKVGLGKDEIVYIYQPHDMSTLREYRTTHALVSILCLLGQRCLPHTSFLHTTFKAAAYREL